MYFKDFSQKLAKCRAEKFKLHSSDETDEIFLADAFNIQAQVISLINKEIIGWKLGGTNDGSRNATGFYEVFWGPLFDKTIFSSSATLNDPLLLGAEVEIALKVSAQLNVEELSDFTEVDYGKIFSQVALAIELPCSSVTSGGGGAIVADLCASGYAVISDSIHYHKYDSSRLSFDVYLNNKFLLSGDDNYLCEKLEKLVVDFITSASAKGFLIKPGQWILAGGLTPLIEVRDGDTVLVKSELFEPISACFASACTQR